MLKGGEIIAEGNPEKISQCENSYTGNFLKGMLNKKFRKLHSLFLKRYDIFIKNHDQYITVPA